MNLVQPIWDTAASLPEASALVHSSRSLNYRETHEATLLVASNLQRLGIRPQDRVAVAPDNPVMHLLCLLALAHIGAVSTPAYRQMPEGQWRDLVARCRIRALIYSPAGAPWPVPMLACLPSQGQLPDSDLLESLPAGTAAAPMADLPPDSPWRIGLSSGTTGQPKAIARSHGAYAADLRATQKLLGLGPGTRLMPHVDLATFYGMRSVLSQLMEGGTVVLAESAGAQDCLRSMLAHQVTHLHTTTWLASELAAALPTSAAAQRITPQARLVMVGGAAPDPIVCGQLLRHIAPQLANNYGSSETGILAMADVTGPAEAPRIGPLTLMPWVRAQAVDAQGHPLPADMPGLLLFDAEHAAACYEADPAASAAVFRDGWFCPGDRGSINTAGHLLLGARQDDLINLGGVKLDPLVVEAVIAQHPAVQACAVVGLARPSLLLVAAVVPASGTDSATLQTLPEALRQACASQLAPDQVPAAWIILQALPRNAQGKLLRQALVEMLERDLTQRPADQV